MTKRLFIMLFVLGLFYCASAVPARGQTTDCSGPWVCSWYSFNSGCIPTPPQGSYNCQYNGPWAQVCRYKTKVCSPPAIECPDCGGSATRPISLASGNTYITEPDVRIPGLSSGLALSRIWNSIWPLTQASFSVGLFGRNWRSTYEERIFVGSDNYIKYSRNDGTYWSFAYAGAAYAPVAPANATATLNVDSNLTYWTLTFQNGEQRIFNYSGGWLTSIIDRNSNTTQVTYDALNRLVAVADPGGRHLYFGYANNSSYLITSVTSDVGLSLSYSYDSLGRLIQVTKPDQTTLSYVYDSNSMITAVKDSDGKTLESHTYDSCGRGLSGSRAGGVEAVTLAYNQPCWTPAPAGFQYGPN
jgi:YD repeat-containing protein